MGPIPKRSARRDQPPVDRPLPAEQAKPLILEGRAPAGLRVEGRLDLSSITQPVSLPTGLTVSHLDLSGSTGVSALPEGLAVRRLNLDGCTGLDRLPAGLDCYAISMRGVPVRGLPADLRVAFRLDLSGCTRLEALPAGLRAGSLILQGCTGLRALPEGLEVTFLDVSGCTNLERWPREASVEVGRFTASDCPQITSLPPWLTSLAQLDVSGCVRLSALPEGLVVSSWVDLAGTQIRSLPPSMAGVQLRWRGVPVDERIAFHPETLTAEEVLAEGNVELRRVMLERMGSKTFFEQAQAVVLDQDVDAGGDRWLLTVPLERDEDLVCLSVACPSTGRRYVLRVPPTIRTCHQAAAWVAGFDDPDDYHPLVET